MKTTPFTKSEFKQLAPYSRGYAVYMYGCRDDEPNVPDEENPYPKDSEYAKKWSEGQFAAMIVAQDGEE